MISAPAEETSSTSSRLAAGPRVFVAIYVLSSLFRVIRFVVRRWRRYCECCVVSADLWCYARDDSIETETSSLFSG